MKFKNKTSMATAALVLCTALTACADAGKANSVSTSANISNSSVNSAIQTAAQSSTMFSDRDREIGYDESSCVAITLSDSGSSVNGDSVTISGSTVTITAEGSYLLSGSLTNGQIIVNVADTQKVQLILDGVSIANSSTAPIYVMEADKVFITLAANSQNIMSVTGAFVVTDDNKVDAAIFSKGDLTLNGNGSLNIDNAYGNGISSKDDLVVTSGSYTVTALGHAIEGKDSIRIASGSFKLSSDKDGLHSDNTEDAERGFVYIDGGSFEINSADDGIHAETDVTINAGTLLISESYEGIEGYTITINGGEIDISSSDDGLNAAGGTDSSGMGGRQTPAAFAADNAAVITINGGLININAEGDGIDSNGAINISGGEIYVSGPSTSGNGALDYNGAAVITGGVLVATGDSGMAQNFGQNSTQGSMLITAQSKQSGTLTVTNSAGDELVSYTPDKSYNSALISLPTLTVGESYTVTMGNETQGIALTELIYGSFGMGADMGKMKGGRGDGMRGAGEPPELSTSDPDIPII